jgi:HD-GYP domain-containing protein (c-di-GMP phosphodiesterase class II)/pSer/pThr/pTyr-binding forkhead associated (FHA) protein
MHYYRDMRFEFAFQTGKSAGRIISITTGQTLTVGRLKDCDLVLDDEAASRRHCFVQAHAGVCLVSDLQSANGTYVNDQKILTAELHPGDTVRIGATELELTAAEDDTPAEPSPNSTESLVLVDGPNVIHLSKAVDPAKPSFLAQALASPDDGALLRSTQQYLSAMHEVSKAVSSATTLAGLFDAILTVVLDVTTGDRAAILMREAGGAVAVSALRTRDGASDRDAVVVSRTVVNDVLERGVTTCTSDAMADDRYGQGQSIVAGQIRTVLCAPIRTSERILGVLYLDSRQAHDVSEAEFELLAAIGNQAGVAVHRTQLLADMERLFLDVTKAIAAIIDAKDGYTHRHSERVAQLAVRLAGELGLDGNERGLIELSALLHDVGKIGVPDAILNKPSELTEAEQKEMRRHPTHGAAILGHIDSPRVVDLLPGVRHHHERWDGGGYPDALKGDAIPLIGRVLAVADFIDAATTDRTYCKGVTLEAAIAILRGLDGKAFDPAVVRAALALHDRGELALPVAPGPELR